MRIAPPRTSRSPVRRFYAPGGGNRGGLAPQLVTGKRISQWWIKRVLWTVAASAAQILPLRAGDDAQRPMLMVGGIRHERARVDWSVGLCGLRGFCVIVRASPG